MDVGKRRQISKQITYVRQGWQRAKLNIDISVQCIDILLIIDKETHCTKLRHTSE